MSATGNAQQQQGRRERISSGLTFELIETPNPEIESSGGASPDSSSSRQQQYSHLISDRWLGGGRMDPFRVYPETYTSEKLVAVLVDHYVIHMARDIPELDQPGNRGLLRTSWFPFVVSSPAAFQAILLLAASNLATVKEAEAARQQILSLKSDAITSINAALEVKTSQVSDALIGAVAKMASFEAMHGTVETYRIHMDGLQKMILMRGGLKDLGLNGLLRRIVIWVDVNSAFLLQVPRYFPGATFSEAEDLVEPNPEQFIAV